MTDFIPLKVTRDFDMQRDTAFRYTCNRCMRCCRNKVIPLNPYEVLRLARNQGVTTEEFTAQSTLNGEGAALRFHTAEDGAACIFLGPEGCTVHKDRPLACRLYPLARWTAGPGIEAFSRVEPEPDTAGVYGEDGTIADFLKAQGVEPYFAAADRYLALYTKLADVAERIGASGVTVETPNENWLDVDAVVGKHCAQQGLAVPEDPDELIQLHIQIVEGWLEGLESHMSTQASS